MLDVSRCRTVLQRWLEDHREILEERMSDDSYRSPEEFLRDHDELNLDVKAIEDLAQYLERL